MEEVCFLVGGGRDAARVGVRLEGRAVGPGVAGAQDEMLREACLDGRAAGPASHIVVYDHGSDAWDHVLADDFECLARGRPIACGGVVQVREAR